MTPEPRWCQRWLAPPHQRGKPLRQVATHILATPAGDNVAGPPSLNVLSRRPGGTLHRPRLRIPRGPMRAAPDEPTGDPGAADTSPRTLRWTRSWGFRPASELWPASVPADRVVLRVGRTGARDDDAPGHSCVADPPRESGGPGPTKEGGTSWRRRTLPRRPPGQRFIDLEVNIVLTCESGQVL